MRILNGLKLIGAIVAISGTASAADIIIDNQSIPGTDVNSITISPATGNLNIATIPGYTVTRNGTTPPPPSAVAITSFLATPATITEGQSTSLSWNTQNAASCTPTVTPASNGAEAWAALSIGLPSGSTNITISTAGSYTFTLTCVDTANGSAVRNAVVTVNTPAPPPVPGSCATPSLTGIDDTWLELWGFDFPQPGFATRDDNIPFSGYKSYQFNTGNVVDNGLLTEVANTQTSGLRRGAISECPGDFNVAPECDHAWGIGGGITWATDGKAGACQLQPNTTYYFNMTFTDGFDPNSSTCSGSPCRITIQHINR